MQCCVCYFVTIICIVTLVGTCGLKAINKILDLTDLTHDTCEMWLYSQWLYQRIWGEIPSVMMTVWHGDEFRVTGSLCGEFTGERRYFSTKGSCGVLLFLLCKGFWANNRVAADSRRHDPHITSLKWSFYRAISSTTYLHPISVIWWSISVSCLFQFHTCKHIIK